MTKYSWLFLSVIIVIMTTLIAQEISAITVSNTIDSGVGDSIEFTTDGISGFITTYFKLLAFDVEGLPNLVSIWFIPWNLVIGFIIGEIILKAVDIIIPF